MITFQRKRANRRVINEDRLIALLREFGEVQPSRMRCSSAQMALKKRMFYWKMLASKA